MLQISPAPAMPTVARINELPPVAPMAPAPSAPAPAPAPTVAEGATFDRIFDFPGIKVGDHFHLDKGSTAAGWGIKGEGRIDRLTPNAATIWIKGGKFGFHREATIDIDQTGPDTAHLVATQKGQDPFPVEVKVTDAHTNYLRAEATSIKADPSELRIDEQGRFVMDVDDVKDGLKFHLLMVKDGEAPAIAGATDGVAALRRA